MCLSFSRAPQGWSTRLEPPMRKNCTTPVTGEGSRLPLIVEPLAGARRRHLPTSQRKVRWATFARRVGGGGDLVMAAVRTRFGGASVAACPNRGWRGARNYQGWATNEANCSAIAPPASARTLDSYGLQARAHRRSSEYASNRAYSEHSDRHGVAKRSTTLISAWASATQAVDPATLTPRAALTV